MLIVLLPDCKTGSRVARVCLCLSVWTSVKQPKLATVAASLSHVVAARVVEMNPHGSRPGVFVCSATSEAWVVKPQLVVAVLAAQNFKEKVDDCEVELTDESKALIEETALLGKYYTDLCTFFTIK